MHLNFETYGEGPPVVILHGLFGSLENWRSVAKALAPSFAVHLVDLRNHGGSPHGDDFDYPAMAGDVRVFLEDRGLQRASVVGHSMGGKVAMYFAVTWPDLVHKLVVVDIAPKEYHYQHREILDALIALHPERFAARREVDAALSADIPDSLTRLFLLKNLVTGDSGRFAWRINLDAISRHYPELVRGLPADGLFPGPTLFIRGENSNYIREEDSAAISRFFPAARLETVPDAGHWVHADNPAAFLVALRSFLQAA